MKQTLKKSRILLHFLPAILVTLIIFGLSLQPGGSSTQTTGAISNTIAGVLSIDPGTTEGTIHGIGGINIERINLFIRSIAHVLEFGGLGLMIILGCTLSQLAIKWHILLTLGLGSIIALIDETIKLFVPGRHFNGIDAVKDVVGLILALIGCYCLKLMYDLYQKYRTGNTSHVHKA